MNLEDPGIQASILLMMITDSSRELFENVSSFCHQTKPAFLDDALLRTDNSIQLSWPTIVHPEMGAPIIAHEIGHAIQNIWPGAILSENICLITKQGGLQYLSADFADLFSAEVMRRLGGVVNGLQTKNLGCGLVEPKGDRGLLTFNNTDKTDPHSSALYRLLASAAGQKNMTQECSAYLAQTGETRFVDYCRWGN